MSSLRLSCAAAEGTTSSTDGYTRLMSSKKHRRGSAGGMALHHWQHKQAKHTTIHVVYELEKAISVGDLQDAVCEKLLKRFPRFRGFVTADERHWEVPDVADVDPAHYVESVTLSATSPDAEPEVLRQHVARVMTQPLPARRSWNVQLVTFPANSSGRCYIVWRISHTVADGVILAQIMSRCCVTSSTTRRRAPPPRTRRPPRSPHPSICPPQCACRFL